MRETLADRPGLMVSQGALEAGRANCAAAYGLAASMEAPLDEALAAALGVRALATTMRGVAQLFLGLGTDGAWFGSNGLSVWVIKGKLAVAAYHPAVDKEASVVGKALGIEVNKIK